MKRPGTVITPNFCGIERLWEHRVLNVNGQLVSPSLFLAGTDFDNTAKTLADRVTATVLAEAGAGASPTKGYAPWARDGAVEFAGGKYLEAPNVTFGQIETEDFWIVIVGRTGSAGNTGYLISKSDGGDNTWGVFWGTAILNCTFNDGTGPLAFAGHAAVGSRFILGVGVNRDEASANGARSHTNGAFDASADPSARQLTLDKNSTYFCMGARNGPAALFDGCVDAAIVYKAANMWAAGATGAAQMLEQAQIHTELLFGARAPHHVAGTPRPSSW